MDLIGNLSFNEDKLMYIIKLYRFLFSILDGFLVI